MSKLLVKWFIKGLILASMLGAMIFAFLPEKIPVDLAVVSRGDILITLSGEGKTRIHDIYVVSTPIDGRVTRLDIEPGDWVEAGKTVLANMYPTNPQFLDKRSETQAKADVDGARAALALAQARVKQAKAQLEFDRADFERTKTLFAKNTLSKAELERAELRLKTLQAELETAESNEAVMLSHLEVAQARLLQPGQKTSQTSDTNCQICIHSPVNGRVLRVRHKSESVVAMGTPLVEIGDPTDLEVIVEMLSNDAVRVAAGHRAWIKHWGGGQPIAAEVRMVEPSGFTKISALGVEEQRVNVLLTFNEPQASWKKLGDAYRVEAEILVESIEDVVRVPLSALFRDNENWSVFKLVDGSARLTQVEVGLFNDQWAEIKAGLVENDQLVVHPGNRLVDGASVVARIDANKP